MIPRILALLLACLCCAAAPPKSDFQIGADVSSLPQVEAAGGVFTDHGTPGNALLILKSHGITHARLRIWNHPKDGICGLEQTLAMARRLKKIDIPFLLDFHYSDTWADPAHQPKPAAWADLHGSDLEDAVYRYTHDVIDALDRQGTPPAMVQVGNEISNGMLWDDGKLGGKGEEAETRWHRFGGLVKAGVRGVKTARPGRPPIPVMIHIDRGCDNAACHWFYDHLLAEGIQFDAIGLSYYPWWHGTRAKLLANLNDLSTRYKKDLFIAETSYPWSPEGVDHNYPANETFPPTVEGQKSFLAALVQTVQQVDAGRCKGIYYWEPAWLSTPKSPSPWKYRGLFGANGELLDSIHGLTSK